MFADRSDAGKQLARKLLSGGYRADLVVGLARGGVAVSAAISRALGIPQNALRVKKIGSPGNPELAIGATVPAGQAIDVRDKCVILTDDGIATGATMKASIDWIQSHGAKKILVAIPVAPPEVVSGLRGLVHDVIVLETPDDFGAVGEFYRNFPQLSDADVVKLLT
jgi:predicted phosphoribosyltransferase